MKVEFREYETNEELYVNGILVLSRRDMDAREALEAISGFSREMEFRASELNPEGTSSLFDDRFFSGGHPRTLAKGV